ncbi:hypothetical protein BMF94_2952 [Rhodotorula taiwanensis]|uniref:Uncharacterized protein n=1 Tax=Rhodotorula taiwanensis TaxID=741276 RepID=A0A2S5BBJ4_9BASI|nr:hypothetical protein BMF94_2952 [Rhodotorula taiwanensis]
MPSSPKESAAAATDPREPARAPEDRSDDETDDDDDEDGEVSPLESSEELLAPESLAPSSLSTVRSRLFASDDEDDYGDILEDDGILSMSGGDSCGSAFSPGSLLSLASPARRAVLSIEAATSDPLRHSLSSPPTLEFDHVRQRGHWIPARSAPTSETVWNAPDVPDVVVRPATPSVPTSPSTTPPSSPPRGATTPSGRPESLLSKSLRSLARLPNLTLADVLPRAAVPVPEEDLTALPPGWGPAERRRVLAAEPSHAADEARAGFRYLLRRPPSPFSAGRRLAAAAVASGSRKSVEFGHPIDEVEALGYGFGFGLQDLGCAASPAALAPDAGSGDEEDNLAQLRARAPTSPSADVPPLPPRALERPRSKESSPPADPVPAPSSIPVTDDDESPVEASAPLSPPPSLPPRFISNHRHLLMLSLEFEMMRHAKIRGPLRQRAVIVRQATSPPRERGVTRERSRLSQEVNLVGAA